MARPAQFDPDEALQRSLLVFWRQGWAGTSIEDLVEATGVNRHSLYARWTDKHGLYQAALAHYFDTVGATWLAPLADERVPPLTAVRSTLRSLRDAVLGDTDRRGCFALNTLLERSDDAGLHALIRATLDRVQAAWALALGRAADQGEIPRESVEPRAAFFALTMQALLLQSRAAPHPDTLHQFVEVALSILPPEVP